MNGACLGHGPAAIVDLSGSSYEIAISADCKVYLGEIRENIDLLRGTILGMEQQSKCDGVIAEFFVGKTPRAD
jgi:hypothetical protein